VPTICEIRKYESRTSKVQFLLRGILFVWLWNMPPCFCTGQSNEATRKMLALKANEVTF
jgi:hypothetical protein